MDDDRPSSQSHHEPDELGEAKLEKNSSTLFTTETRSTQRGTENPGAAVKSRCPPCLRGETGHVTVSYFRRNFSARSWIEGRLGVSLCTTLTGGAWPGRSPGFFIDSEIRFRFSFTSRTLTVTI